MHQDKEMHLGDLLLRYCRSVNFVIAVRQPDYNYIFSTHLDFLHLIINSVRMSSLEHTVSNALDCDSDSESSLSMAFSATDRPSSSGSSTPPLFAFPTNIPSYGSAALELREILRVHDPSSEIVHDALLQVALSLPFHAMP